VCRRTFLDDDATGWDGPIAEDAPIPGREVENAVGFRAVGVPVVCRLEPNADVRSVDHQPDAAEPSDWVEDA
jgi:hypothetical protein